MKSNKDRWRMIFSSLVLCMFIIAGISACGGSNVTTPDCSDSIVNINSCDTNNNTKGSNATATSTVTTLQLAPEYQGTIKSLTANLEWKMTLTSIVQHQNEISGNVVMERGWIGSGPFTGTISSDGSVYFTDQPSSGYSIIVFRGVLNKNGSLGGRYTVPDLNHRGIWDTKPVS